MKFLIWSIAVTGVAAMATTAYMRAELLLPGLMWQDAGTATSLYRGVSLLHGVVGGLLAAAVAGGCGALVRHRARGRIGGLVKGLALALLAAQAGVLLLLIPPVGQAFLRLLTRVRTGETVDLPAMSGPREVFDTLGFIEAPTMRFLYLSAPAVLSLIALTLLVSARPTRRCALPYLVCAIATWIAYATISGNLVPLPPAIDLSGTTYVAAQNHGLLVGFGLFALCAFVAGKADFRGARVWLWIHAAGVGALSLAAFVPLIWLAFQGLPRGYPDYPQSMERLQHGLSLASFALLAWIAGGCAAMVRRRG